MPPIFLRFPLNLSRPRPKNLQTTLCPSQRMNVLRPYSRHHTVGHFSCCILGMPNNAFSSISDRCLQTSKPVAIALDIPIFVEHGKIYPLSHGLDSNCGPGISEWYSPVARGTGLHPRPGSASSLKAYFPEISSEAWSSVWYPSRKGEDVPGVHDRIDGFLKVFLPHVQRTFAGKHTRILLVSHAATVIALTRSLVADRQVPLRIGCCTLCEVEKHGSGWKATKLADGSHLSRGSERDWGFEDIEIAHGQVVADHGEPADGEVDEPVGPQIQLVSNL